MKKFSKRQLMALEKSIKHWERMLAQAEKQSPLNRPSESLFKELIEESWRGEDCPLCNLYSDNQCISCPLYLSGFWCESRNSPWKKVDRSVTWKQWIKNAEKFIKIMKKIK